MKRKMKRLKWLREALVAAPADRVHMGVIRDETTCGAAHCLLGWGMTHPELQREGIPTSIFTTVDDAQEFFGLTKETAVRLFAFPSSLTDRVFHALITNPHTISKRAALSKLDRVIAGKPIKPYRVKVSP